MEALPEVVAEGYRPVPPFDPSMLLAQIKKYRAAFQQELLEMAAETDEFERIRGKIIANIKFRRLTGGNIDDIRELSSLIPDLSPGGTDPIPLVHACDLVDKKKSIDTSEPLNSNSEHLYSLKAQVKRLSQIAESLSDDTILHPLLIELIGYYQQFQLALCQEGSDIAELLKPKPVFSCLGAKFSQMAYEDALRGLGLTVNAIGRRDFLYGEHNTGKLGQLVFKAKIAGREFEFGNALLAANIYQLFNRRRRVATPVTLGVISHVECIIEGELDKSLEPILEYSHQTPCFRNVVQITAFSEGVLSDDRRQLEQLMTTWREKLGDEKLISLIRNRNDPDSIRELSEAANIEKAKIEQIPAYLEALEKMFEKYSPEKAVVGMSEIRKKRDRYSLCAKIVVDIFIVATDMKASNTTDCFVKDPLTGELVNYEEGFDVDRAFAVQITKSKSGHHHINTKSIDLFDDLNFEFDADLKEELLEFPAIFLWLTIMKLCYEDDFRFNELLDEMVLKERDRFDGEVPMLGMPSGFITGLPQVMLDFLRKMQDILPKIKTLEEFVDKMMPFFIAYRNLLLKKHNGNVLEAYHEHHGGVSIETVYSEAGLACPDLSGYDRMEKDNDLRTMSCAEGVKSGVVEYTHKGKIEQHFQYLQYVAENFPFITSTSYTREDLERLVLNFHRVMFFNALELLSRCKANFKAVEKGETILHRVLSREHLDKVFESRKIIDFLLKHDGVELNAICEQGFTPFIAFVRSAKNYSIEFIRHVVQRFSERGVDIGQVINLKSALDVAVELDSKNLFIALVENRVTRCTNMDLVLDFMRRYQNDSDVTAAAKLLAVFDPYFSFQWALSRVSVSKQDKNHTQSVEGNHNKHFYLHHSVASQLFDDQGNLAAAEVNVEFDGEPLFYALSESQYSKTELLSSRFHHVLQGYAAHSEVFQCQNREKRFFKVVLVTTTKGGLLTDFLSDNDRKKSLLDGVDVFGLVKLIVVAIQLRLPISADRILVSDYELRGQSKKILRTLPFSDVIVRQVVEGFEVKKCLMPFESLRSVRFDVNLISELLQLNSHQLLVAWKEALWEHHCRLVNQSLGTLRGRRNSFEAQSSVQFHSGEMSQYFYNLEKIFDILREIKTPDYTVGDFMDSLVSVFVDPKNQNNLIENTHQNKGKKTKLKDFRRHLSQSVKEGVVKLKSRAKSTKEIRQSDVSESVSEVTETGKPLSLVEVGNELRELSDAMRKLEVATQEIQNGEFKAFSRLDSIYQQRAFNSVKWKKLSQPDETGPKILDQAVDLRFTEFRAVDCLYLTEQTTSMIVGKSAGLRVLDLSGSITIPDNLSGQLSRSCEFLRELVLDRTLIFKLSLTRLYQLKRLSANNCMNLREVQADTPEIVELSFKACRDLEAVQLISRARKLVRADINHCISLDPKSLRRLSMFAHNLRDLQHLEVPYFNLRGLVKNVTKNRGVTPEVAKSLVQNGLLDLFGINLPEEILFRIITYLSRDIKGSFLDKTQRLTKIDLRGCPYPLKTIASTIASAPHLEGAVFQTNLTPTMDEPIPFSLKMQQAPAGPIKKTMQLPNGYILFFYNDASYKVWDIHDNDGLKLIHKDRVGDVFYDADILPSNDIIICCDGVAKVLDTVSWEISDRLCLETDDTDKYHCVKVINQNRLVLGGKHLSIYQITGEQFVFKRSIQELTVKMMALTPNHNIFVIQTELSGIIIWRLDDNQFLESVPGDLLGENSRSVSTIVIIDNFNMILVDSYSGIETNLNLRTKQKSTRDIQLGVRYGVMGPNGTLVLGGETVNDIIIDSSQNKPYTYPYKKTLQAIFKQVQGKMGEAFITDHGDLVVVVDKSAWLVRNEYLDLDLKFVVGLPTQLSVNMIRTSGQAAKIQIRLPEVTTVLENNAFGELKSFIGKMFGLTPFAVIDEERMVVISGLPVEDVYSYQIMFESFVQRAIEYQTKELPAVNKQLSTRPISKGIFSSPSRDTLGDSGKSSSRKLSRLSFGPSGDDIT